MNEIKDDTIKFVTITYVKITNDLSYAKVYFTALDENRKEELTKALNKASGFIRTKLCDLVQIRKMPELEFIYDDTIAYGSKIENIIESLKEEKDNE